MALSLGQRMTVKALTGGGQQQPQAAQQPQKPAGPAPGVTQQKDGYTYKQPGTHQAVEGMRGLQGAAVGGLRDLMSQDYDASRQKFQDAMYSLQEEKLTDARTRLQQEMAEGQFARGMGQSSSTENLLSDINEDYFDSLSKASRESYLAAGGENRADLAARSGLYGLGFNAATTGLQSEANIGMANARALQQGNQFTRSLASQDANAAANRAVQQQQIQAQMQFNYAQLAEQARQFGMNLDFQTQNALANRAMQMTLAQMQNQFQYANLGGQLGLGYSTLAQNGQLAQGAQDLQRQIAANNLLYQYTALGQNQNQFDATLGQRQDAANSSAIGAGLAGLAGLFAPSINSWLNNFFAGQG